MPLNDKQKSGLDLLLWTYPNQVSKGLGAHLATMRTLAKLGLVEIEEFYDQHWPPRPTRASDKSWAAKLTDAGIQEAMALGYSFHPEDRCILPSSCEFHTPFLQNRIPVPVRKEEPVSAVEESAGKPVRHTRTGEIVGYLQEGKFTPVGGQ